MRHSRLGAVKALDNGHCSASPVNIAVFAKPTVNGRAGPKHLPPTTVAEYRTLEEGEVLEGYLDGVHGSPLPEAGSRSYRHGWRQGMIERGSFPVDEATLALRRDFERLR